MKTLRITKLVRDKENNNKLLSPGDEIEVSNERAKDFAEYSEDITPKEEKKSKKKE